MHISALTIIIAAIQSSTEVTPKAHAGLGIAPQKTADLINRDVTACSEIPTPIPHAQGAQHGTQALST